jgi:para-aminobenzoate synthetase/4-amino-4-deoxychorismate lyase
LKPGQVFEIILRTPWGGPWRCFSEPTAVLAAHATEEVREVLRAVDEAVRHGSYAAGFVTYEAASAFGLPVGAPAAGLPLVAFGLFDPDNVETLHRLPSRGSASVGEWTPSIDHASYLNAIDAIKTHIEAGDTYQINFTFRMTARFRGEPSSLMRDLHAAQAGPWSAYVDLGDRAICAASPELFFSVAGRKALCRPMKGTWPRGYWPAQDVAYGEALARSAKNRAENVMIVDMVRNDLGRVAKTASVTPTSLFNVERYPLQWQMTSDVEAVVEEPRLDRLFEAMFPCGSITGAPKHRSMDIIRDLESSPRGIYTGSIGYVSPRGRTHFNVAIRTVVVDREEGRAEFGVGSGVVWDSVDRDEYEECLLKAEMLGGRRSARRSASYVIGDPPGFRLLETILWRVNGGFALLARHMDRLRASADCFGFTCDIADVKALLNEAVEDLRGPARVRVMLEPDGAVLCEAVDLVPMREPVRLALATAPVDRSDVFLYHKTTRREVYERARALRPDADAVVLWNADGEITESTDCNIVIVRAGSRVTPPIDCGLLPGTMRAELLDAEEIVEGRVTKEDFLAADEVWLINSVRGWMRGTRR